MLFSTFSFFPYRSVSLTSVPFLSLGRESVISRTSVGGFSHLSLLFDSFSISSTDGSTDWASLGCCLRTFRNHRQVADDLQSCIPLQPCKILLQSISLSFSHITKRNIFLNRLYSKIPRCHSYGSI